jgi:hypothetical protein
VTTEQAVQDLSALVGLVLVLITLFMGHREQALRDLRREARPKAAQALAEFLFTIGLILVTALVFVSGLGLWRDTIPLTLRDWGFVREERALTTVFTIVWFFLVPLAVWQAAVARRAWRLRDEIRRKVGS